MPEYSEDSMSEVNYEETQNQDPIPPAGFITNNPTHPFFYPIHIPNPTYRETDNTWTGTRTIVAPFIRYSPDFTTVYVLRHGRDVHPTWVKSSIETLSNTRVWGSVVQGQSPKRTLTVTDDKWLTA